MIKRILFLASLLLVVSCNTAKPVVQTTKPKPKTNETANKPKVIRKPHIRVEPENPPVMAQKQEPIIVKQEVLEATTRVKVTKEIVLAYINKFKEVAKSNMTQYGIPSSIILAQGILESGAGTGPLSIEGNNHFGIKCHKEWNGKTIKHDDDSAQECFRKYDQPMESYKDHALFLTSRPWYAGLFKLNKDDYKGWAKGLRSAGYATDPKYPEKLIGIIERYQLGQYDAEVLGHNYTSMASINLVASNAAEYQVAQGDTLYSISKKFNLTIEELKRKNNMSDNAISIGQNLRVQ
ncbi:glucosaminidase domain-containing protein [Flavobacterium sp. GT3R68]|uniref:glucosaminidase domain-containing protein n=1 Tax=Flavobacterium sp. GT3R68 TaxID=2594437 RepID=UPI000F88D877|nr:glucosaminidase domain-containing protein [Flavobacterium sp. GT3R68]RTY90246.1 LysM peptidoglycan-binding domain-containing protein [Flavobacterium sp. GSN2]TRW90547.1 LysM peptidoglycan-binding domain-containing protein [Flavobacterium sp. GT3R68]